MKQYGDFKNIQRLGDDLEHLGRRVERITQTFCMSGNELDWDLSRVDQEISQRIRSIQSEMELISACFRKHANYIWDIRYTYVKLENELVGIIERISEASGNEQVSGVHSGTPDNVSVQKLFNEERNIAKTKLPNLQGINKLKVVTGKTIDREETVVETWLDIAAQDMPVNVK